MQSIATPDRHGEPDFMGDSGNLSADAGQLEQQSLRNWYLLAGMCAISTVGLLIAVTPSLRHLFCSLPME